MKKKKEKTTNDNNKNLPGKKGNTIGNRFSSTNQPAPGRISEGMARAKSIREWKSAIRERVFAEFMARDIEEFSNKELNQTLRTVWNDEIKDEDSKDTTPTINFIEGVDKNKI